GPDGRSVDVTPEPFNARTRVHEYGGGDFAAGDGRVVFSNFLDQRLYLLDAAPAPPGASPGGAGAPRPLTPEGRLRFADAVFDPARGRLLCVREDHSVEGRQAESTPVAVGVPGGGARQAGGGSWARRGEAEGGDSPPSPGRSLRSQRLRLAHRPDPGGGPGSGRLAGSEDGGRILVAGNDFYASPRLSPD